MPNAPMLATLRTLLTRWFGLSPAPEHPVRPELVEGQSPISPTQTDVPISSGGQVAVGEGGHHVPYDENLLERSRTQWQFGDWESLAKLERDTLQHHPDRAKLALLAAAGRLQTDKSVEARQFIRLAQDWGCSKKLITQILVAGVHNSLGRASAVIGQQPRALQHFKQAITTGTPGSDLRLITTARVGEQYRQIKIPLALQPKPELINTLMA